MMGKYLQEIYRRDINQQSHGKNTHSCHATDVTETPPLVLTGRLSVRLDRDRDDRRMSDVSLLGESPVSVGAAVVLRGHAACVCV